MGISALSTRSNGNLTTCYGVPGLSSQQMRVCENKPDLIPTLRHGANLGITECKNQFEKERWNCSTTNSSSVFGEVINIGKLASMLSDASSKRVRITCCVSCSFVTGSREAGFVYAITSAGVVHAASKACRLGNLSECACETRRKRKQQFSGWEWGGCDDDVKFGISLSKMFVDAPEYTARAQIFMMKDRKTRSARAKKGRYLMNLHNNEVGRRVS